MAAYAVKFSVEGDEPQESVVTVTHEEIDTFKFFTGLSMIDAIQALTLSEIESMYPTMTVEILDRHIVDHRSVTCLSIT